MVGFSDVISDIMWQDICYKNIKKYKHIDETELKILFFSLLKCIKELWHQKLNISSEVWLRRPISGRILLGYYRIQKIRGKYISSRACQYHQFMLADPSASLHKTNKQRDS